MRARYFTHISLGNTPPHLCDKIQPLYKELVYTGKAIENEIKISNNQPSEILQQALINLDKLSEELRRVFIEMDRMFESSNK